MNQARPRARRVLTLRASIFAPSPVPGCALRLPAVASDLRTVLQDGLPPFRHSLPARRQRLVAHAPMSYPLPCLACNGLSRHILGR
uniref:Uncharacterized protein n=1 Tax=Pseudomonas sp. GLE121 TaxID=1329969 RepID=R4LBT0_9PSED|nr:hypothetical protein [Pseudomonas sp. GLE121]